MPEIILLLSLILTLGQIKTNNTRGEKEAGINAAVLSFPENSTATGGESVPEIKAVSACVYDINSEKFLFSKNSLEVRPLASLVKLMTAVAASESFSGNPLIEVTYSALNQEGDNGLMPGQALELNRLLELMLVASSNDAAYAIAASLGDGTSDKKFAEIMNEKAKNIGLNRLYFFNPTGLDPSEKLSGGYGTCEDTAKLAAYIIKNHPEICAFTNKKTTEMNGKSYRSTNELLPVIPFFILGKTGTNDLAGANLLIAADSSMGRPISIVILGSDKDNRFKDAEILYNKYVAGL